jgi:hypothetical protein
MKAKAKIMVSRCGGGGEKVLKNRNGGGRKYGGGPRWESKMRRGSFSFTLSGVDPRLKGPTGKSTEGLY